MVTVNSCLKLSGRYKISRKLGLAEGSSRKCREYPSTYPPTCPTIFNQLSKERRTIIGNTRTQSLFCDTYNYLGTYKQPLCINALVACWFRCTVLREWSIPTERSLKSISNRLPLTVAVHVCFLGSPTPFSKLLARRDHQTWQNFRCSPRQCAAERSSFVVFLKLGQSKVTYFHRKASVHKQIVTLQIPAYCESHNKRHYLWMIGGLYVCK